MKHYAIILLLAAFTSWMLESSCRAWPPTFGVEFNFGNKELDDSFMQRKMAVLFGTTEEKEHATKPNKAEHSFAQRMRAEVQKLCNSCAITSHHGKFNRYGDYPEYEVSFPDGWKFNIAIDPGCVEIQTKPETQAEIERNVPRMNDFIFKAANNATLDAIEKRLNKQLRAGHINIGVRSAFGESGKEFLRFFIDYQNFPELGLGALGIDTYNGAPLTHLGSKNRKEMEKIVQEVNEGKLSTIAEVARAIQQRVYTTTASKALRFSRRDRARGWNQNIRNAHYQAIGLKAINSPGFPENDRPLEIRPVRQMHNAEEYALITKLFEKRMEFLRTYGNEPIIYNHHADRRQGKVMSALFPMDSGDEKWTPERIASKFYIYVTESGLEWEPYRKFMSAHHLGVLDSFVSGSVNWNYFRNVGEVASYVPDLATSPWVRKRMLELLSTPEAAGKGKGEAIIDAIIKWRDTHPSPHKTRILNDFLTQVLSRNQWKSMSRFSRMINERSTCLDRAMGFLGRARF